MKIQDRTILLTGATGGIGKALALMLARRGASLLLSARNAAKLAALEEQIEALGGQAEIVAADLSTNEGRQAVVAAAAKCRVDTLINNAGTNHLGLYATQSEASIESLLTNNLVAPMLLTRALLPVLFREGDGCIVNVGSILGSLATPGQAAYSASKFALRGFNEALRRELTAEGIRVIYVAPRATDTGMNDDRAREMNARIGVAMDTAEHVACEIVDAMTRDRRERFLGWPEKLFVRINALFPGLVDRGLGKQRLALTEIDTPADGLALTTGVKQ